MEKVRLWEGQTDNKNSSPRHKLDSASPSMTSESGQWLPTPEFDYKPKLFSDPRDPHSDKENMLPLEPIPMPVLNTEESDFLDRTEKLLEKDNKWEAHIAQQVPLPGSSSPYPNDKPRSLEQLESETDDDIDVRDFSERPANDKKPPKPICKPKVMLQSLFLTPPGCPDYMAMHAATTGIVKPQSMENRGILPKKKVTQGWATCLKRLPLKPMFHYNDIYVVHTEKNENYYEEHNEKESWEEWKPREKNMRVFYKLNVKDNVDLTNIPHEGTVYRQKL